MRYARAVSGITRDEVERIAELARLSLEGDVSERMTHDLAQILGYVEALQQLDTTDVPPTAHVLPLATPMRDDTARPSLAPERVTGIAPSAEGTAFVVPQVIEGEDDG